MKARLADKPLNNCSREPPPYGACCFSPRLGLGLFLRLLPRTCLRRRFPKFPGLLFGCLSGGRFALLLWSAHIRPPPTCACDRGFCASWVCCCCVAAPCARPLFGCCASGGYEDAFPYKPLSPLSSRQTRCAKASRWVDYSAVVRRANLLSSGYYFRQTLPFEQVRLVSGSSLWRTTSCTLAHDLSAYLVNVHLLKRAVLTNKFSSRAHCFTTARPAIWVKCVKKSQDCIKYYRTCQVAQRAIISRIRLISLICRIINSWN